MNRDEWTSVWATTGSILLGGLIAWAGSQGGAVAGPLPVFAICAILAFALNWIGFVPAFLLQTERYFDLIGSVTYLSLVTVALVLHHEPSPRALLLAGMVGVWAVRLGRFLFARIGREGHDARFDALKPSFPRFLMTWTLQGLWVLLTVSCALAAMTAVRPTPLGIAALGGGLIWAIGFAIEVSADRQKARFRADPANRDRFIQTGLWAWSRHPNYFGEITLWCGVAVLAIPALSKWQYVTLISPLFVYVLLTRVSGIPLLEERAERRWGDQAAYRIYKADTPALFPRPPRSI